MMDAVVQSFLSGFPVFLLHFLLTLVMLVVGVAIYIWITPHREFHLIRQGNCAAAVSRRASTSSSGATSTR